MKPGARRVLIVDDEPSIVFGLSRTLGRRGWEVATASTAGEARRAAFASPPALVLLDLRLPDEEGLALLSELTRLAPAPRVIVMTGFALPDMAEAARASGAARVLQKPVDIDELLRIVDEPAPG